MLNGKLYIISNPYAVAKYSVCDLNSNPYQGITTPLNLSEGVFSPAGIDVDPATGEIFVLSYNQGENGYADYYSNGYVKRYSKNGSYMYSYDTGVGPCAVFFNVGVKTIFDN